MCCGFRIDIIMLKMNSFSWLLGLGSWRVQEWIWLPCYICVTFASQLSQLGRFTTSFWVCWLHCKIMGCDSKHKGAKAWRQVSYSRFLKIVSCQNETNTQLFLLTSKSGSTNRLRSLKTLHTKSTPVYSLRVNCQYLITASLLQNPQCGYCL